MGRHTMVNYPPIEIGETQTEYKKRKQSIRNIIKRIDLCEFDIDRDRLIADLDVLGYKYKK
jgi:hypothetical protein